MLGERIKKARKTRGLTQEDIANRIGVKRSVISKYENGLIEPSISQLKKIADVLELEWHELYSDDPNEQAFILVEDIREAGIAAGIFRKNESDRFVEMFNSPILQELGRRGVEIEERKRKNAAEMKGRPFVKNSDGVLGKMVKDHITTLLFKHGIFPKDYGSLVYVGYSEADAYYTMERAKLYDDSIGNLDPQHFENARTMAALMDLSVKHDKHDKED